MKKIKVLIVTHRWLPRVGGLQIFSFNLAKILSKNSIVSIITSKEKGVKNYKIKNTKLIEVNSNPFLYNHFSIPHPLFNLKELYIKMKENVIKNDVIIINDRYYLSSLFASYFAKKYSKRKIVILHTSIQNYSCTKKVFYFLNNYIGKFVLKNSECIVGVSEYTLNDVLNYYNIKPKRTEIINNLESNIKKSKKRRAENFSILFVGRIVEEKGIMSLINVAKILKEDNITIKIAGEGKLEKKLLDEIKKNKLKNVHFLGKVNSRKKISQLYNQTDLFILLSTKKEGFSLTTCDALLNSKPVIISKNVPFDHINNYCGYVVNPFDIKDICTKIKQLKENNQVYMDFSKNSYKYSKKNLDPRKNIKKIKELLK